MESLSPQQKLSCKPFPNRTLELLATPAGDEGVHCWRHHRVQNSHRQMQGWGGDRASGADKEGDHSQVDNLIECFKKLWLNERGKSWAGICRDILPSRRQCPHESPGAVAGSVAQQASQGQQHCASGAGGGTAGDGSIQRSPEHCQPLQYPRGKDPCTAPETAQRGEGSYPSTFDLAQGLRSSQPIMLKVPVLETPGGTCLALHTLEERHEMAGPPGHRLALGNPWDCDRPAGTQPHEAVLTHCPTPPACPQLPTLPHDTGALAALTDAHLCLLFSESRHGPKYTGFRLVNGSTACAGRVEVQVLETWGTLCASRWDLSDAHVLCRQLNCGFAESIPGGEHFGRETDPVWRDSFHCDGTETHLGQCPVITLGASPCSHRNNAAVVCSGSASLRLVGGGSRCDGRVEIFQNGTWGRVLDDQWDVQEASVVCRQLQCGETGTAYNPPKPERGTGPVGLRGVRCTGHEANLALCNTSLPESAPAAGVAEDVGVICRGSRRVRLVNGSGHCAGRVEIYYQGIWGTVCDDGWDLSDAAVVCHQLGCGGAVEAAVSAQFGEGSGQIWLDGMNCSGAEAALWDCPARPWGQHDCGHKEDAGVICSGLWREL
ncbi:CD5 antigen-like [Morphnus guianensis]